MISSIKKDAVEESAASGGQAGSRVLEFDEVWFSYDGEPVLRDINFAMSRGEFMAVLGPNGSGKTTLLKLALGLISPSRGSVRLLGQNPAKFTNWREVGYVPQRLESMQGRFPATVSEVVAFGLYEGFDPFRLFRRRRSNAVDRALDVVGIAHLRERRVSGISVGQQQRMLIARAIVREPSVLFMDEPVAGVDTAGQGAFHTLIRRLNREMGITVMLVSHDIGAVMREATTCACINRDMVFHGGVHDITSADLTRLYGFPVDILMHDPEHTHR